MLEATATAPSKFSEGPAEKGACPTAAGQQVWLQACLSFLMSTVETDSLSCA
jgi:hypothetical protein